MKSVLGMCFNWKVLVGLVAAAVVLFLFAPGLAIGALPLLLLAACPLSMVFMMSRMGGGQGHGSHNHLSAGESPESLRERLDAVREEERRLERQLQESELKPVPVAEDQVLQRSAEFAGPVPHRQGVEGNR